jgi:hypothetical protein
MKVDMPVYAFTKKIWDEYFKTKRIVWSFEQRESLQKSVWDFHYPRPVGYIDGCMPAHLRLSRGIDEYNQIDTRTSANCFKFKDSIGIWNCSFEADSTRMFLDGAQVSYMGVTWVT